jgi:hypothetical protein
MKISRCFGTFRRVKKKFKFQCKRERLEKKYKFIFQFAICCDRDWLEVDFSPSKILRHNRLEKNIYLNQFNYFQIRVQGKENNGRAKTNF